VPFEWSAQYLRIPALAEIAPYVGARQHVRIAQCDDFRQLVQNDLCFGGPMHEQGVPSQILRFSTALMLSTICAGQLSSALMG
jgi:hypothetical protein